MRLSSLWLRTIHNHGEFGTAACVFPLGPWPAPLDYARGAGLAPCGLVPAVVPERRVAAGHAPPHLARRAVRGRVLVEVVAHGVDDGGERDRGENELDEALHGSLRALWTVWGRPSSFRDPVAACCFPLKPLRKIKALI